MHRSFPYFFSVFLVVVVLASGCSDDAATSVARQPLYVALGASDSVGTGATNPAAEGWVAQLHSRMTPGTRLANLAWGGATLRQVNEQALPVAVDLQPSVVTVWLAVNDLTGNVPLETYIQDLDLMLGRLRLETRARVYVANLPDLTLLPALSGRPAGALRSEVTRWNAAITETAARNGAQLVDLLAGWQDLRTHPEYISRDGLHPSSAGHRRLADVFWSAITDRP